MLAGSPSSREDTKDPVLKTKLQEYLANHSKPAERVFKQVGRKKEHDYYHRSLFGSLAGFGLLLFISCLVCCYLGYLLTGLILMGAAGGVGAMDYWLTKAIPEVKINHPCADNKPCAIVEKPDMSTPSSPTVIYRGVAFPIKHECEETPTPLNSPQLPESLSARR